MATHPHCLTHHRVSCVTLLPLVVLALTAVAFDVAADGWGVDLLRPSAQMSPYPGQEVTYTVQLTNNFTDNRSLDFSVLWKKPDGDALTVSTHEVELAPGASQSFPQTVTLAGSGQYRIIVYDTLEGPDLNNALGSWTFDVAKVHPSGASDAINTLQITATHTPEFPRAEVRHQGAPEHRDLITLTIAMENVSEFKIFPAGPIQVNVTNPDATTSNHLVTSYEFSLPEIVPGQAHTDTHAFRLDLPGMNTVAIRSNAYGQLATHTIQTVPYVTTSLTSPTVTPAQGPPGTQFVVGVTYLSWDNVAPSAIKVAVAALPGQMFTMQKKTPSDSNYADGCVYTCALPATLPAAEHSICFYAYQGGQEVFNTGMVPGPKVVDNVVPTIAGGGQQQPDVIVRRSGEVTLSGTASDPEGPIDKVEWRVAGGDWQRAVGQESWSFTYSLDVPDQGYEAKAFEVRAYDLAGNVSPTTKYWKQKVVWERRHPKILEHYVTDLGGTAPADMAPFKSVNKPAYNGPPLIGQVYVIAFKVKNMSAIDPYTFDFCWKETAVEYEPEHPPWPLDMDRPGYCVGGPVTIQPLETAWVQTFWIHDWNWIKEKGAYDFLVDATFAFIPIAGELSFGLSALDMLCTQGFAVKETTWRTERAEGMPPSVMSDTPSFKVTVEVPEIKRLLFIESLATSATATLSTSAGALLGWNPAGWALLATEACLIVTAHVVYDCAWDPEPDYKKEVRLEPIECPELDQIEDPQERAYADAALHLAENAIALKQSYVRYLGAEADGNEEMAGKHIRAAAGFAKEAAVQSAMVERQMAAAVKSIKDATAEDQQRARDAIKQSAVPDYEREILTSSFGLSPKQIAPWEELNRKLVPMMLDDPSIGLAASKAMTSHFRTLAQKLQKEAGKYKQ